MMEESFVNWSIGFLIFLKVNNFDLSETEGLTQDFSKTLLALQGGEGKAHGVYGDFWGSIGLWRAP